MSKKNIALLTVILAILIDQIVKIYIKTNFFLGEEVKVFNWLEFILLKITEWLWVLSLEEKQESCF